MKKNLLNRKDIRLKGYDYCNIGIYFITICTKNKECILSKIENKEIECTIEGKIVEKKIRKIESKYTNITVDEYVIMPNHIHMIIKIAIKEKVSISKLIQQLKGSITKEIGYGIWQKLFYEHIVRNEREYILIKEYIINNPINWEKDKYF